MPRVHEFHEPPLRSCIRAGMSLRPCHCHHKHFLLLCFRVFLILLYDVHRISCKGIT